MGMEDMNIMAPVTENAILMTGEQKTARIIAFLVGLGYDLVTSNTLDSSGAPKIVCGTELTSKSESLLVNSVNHFIP